MLYERLDLFQALRDARRQPLQQGGDLLASLLGSSNAKDASAPPTPTPAPDGIDDLIRRMVAPHIVPDTRAQTQSYLNAVDSTTSEQMRRLLHDPTFQALESAWCGAHWLVSNLELDEETLQLHLFDVAREELAADVIAAQGQLAQTGLYRALVDRWRNVPGGEPWALIAGLYEFGGNDADVGLLAALGLIAAQVGCPFIAQGDESLATEPTAAWQALRRSEAAPWLGLAAPRVLLRLPYGQRSDPISAFTFEEMPAAGAPEQEHFLWGNPALAIAMLVGRQGDDLQISDLPAYTYTTSDGERELQACAERYLGEQAGQALLASGLMPLMSHRHRNAVTAMRLQSVADPAQGLPLPG
jgi:type VI secretion system protein ImpC